MTSIILLCIAGLVASASLFRHRQILVLIATGAVIAEALWLFITWFDRVALTHFSSENIYLIGSVIAFALALLCAWKYRPTFPWGQKNHDLRGELIVLGVTCVVMVGSWAVVRVNGFAENDWITHGFYNGDSATFISLTQRSMRTDTLVQENPFAGNGSLEYPTLLHAGMATFLGNDSAGSWLHFLPTLTYVTILLTIPLFFLPIGLADSKRTYTIAAVAVMGLIITASWDSYIYPQSHFFLTGLFLLLIGLLHRAYHTEDNKKHVLEIFGGVTALVLLFSNAVTGTAAMAALGAYMVIQALPGATPQKRPWYILGAGAVLAVFFFASPGEAAFGAIGLSYTAAPDMLRLTPLVALLITGIAMKKRTGYRSLTSTLLLGLAFVTFIFSARDIVVANASRFFYHGLLVGSTIMIPSLQGMFDWARKQLKFRTSNISMQITHWGIALVSVGFLLLPSLTSVASAYDNLLFKDEQVVDSAMRTALWWIDENAEVDDVFLASPNQPFAIPLFTGRALLRTDYWLSPEDIVFEDVQETFAGQLAGAEQVFPLADYLLLTKEERSQFEPLPSRYLKVFDNNAVVIYQLR